GPDSISVQSCIISLWVAGSDAIGKQFASDRPASVTTIINSNKMRTDIVKRDRQSKVTGKNTALSVSKQCRCGDAEYS
ncbi:MAG TPA: hypothetical protein PKK17_10745, partial [Sphingorhabdus lacus]|nr:hypothetical protein [Sphingorhabdus lacus]